MTLLTNHCGKLEKLDNCPMTSKYSFIPPELPSTICYLNGEFCPLAQAKISVLDRGFIFGDGIYEVVPLYFGKPFRFEQHMKRFQRSLKELRIENPFSNAEWLEIINTLAGRFAESVNQKVEDTHQIIYLQISRGVAPRDHVMTKGISPTVFMMTNPLKAISPELRNAGVHCVSAHDFRWEKAHIKATSLLGAVLSRQISADIDATETIMFRGDNLSEASSSNVWIVSNGTVFAPPKDNLLLEGIRYGLIEEICGEIDIPFVLRPISRNEVFNADEVLLSSATKEVLAVTKIDETLIGSHTSHSGQPGPVYKRIYKAYQNYIERVCKNTN